MLETWQGAVEELHCDMYTPSLYTPTNSKDAVYSDLLPDMTALIKEHKRVKAFFPTFSGIVTTATHFRFHCGITVGEIGISFDGNVYPCHLLHKPELKCGNIRKQRLGEILKESEIIHTLRKFNINDVAECRDCDFKYVCAGGCLAMTNNIYGDFHKTSNFYCEYLKQDHLERMWTDTVSDVSKKANHL